MDWLANGSPPWAAYRAFMSGRLIVLDKQPGVRLVGVGETRRRLFAKILLKVTGPEATMACQDDQLFSGLQAGIDGAVHRVQAILDKNLSTEDWAFFRVGAKIRSPAQDVPFFYTPYHLSELKSCKSIISANFSFIFIFK